MTRQLQNDRVLRYFRENPGSTTLEAIRDLGIRNITARMSDLRAEGIEVRCAKRKDGRDGYSLPTASLTLFGDAA